MYQGYYGVVRGGREILSERDVDDIIREAEAYDAKHPRKNIVNGKKIAVPHAQPTDWWTDH